MELLVVIAHPGPPIRDPQRIAADLAGVYDQRAYGMASTRRVVSWPHATLIWFSWGQADLGWTGWHESDKGDPTQASLLATVGLPLLHCPPGGPSTMLTPATLARFIQETAGGTSSQLGYCGGYFAAAQADQATGTVRLVTNYLGEVPLYQAAHAGVTVWSNKAAAAAMLAGLEPKLDEQAAHEFALLSHCLEDRTLWQGVSVVPPASCIVIDPQGVTQRQYLDLPGAYFEHRLPASEVGPEVVRAMGPLVEAINASDREVRIHLSGGQDSRAVAAMFRHHNSRPLCFTHNTPNEETPSAQRLAKFLGMRYRTADGVLPSWETFITQAQQSLWQSDGMMSFKYLAGLYDLAYIRDQGYLPIEGLGGEFGRGYYYGSEEGSDYLTAGRFDYFYKKCFGQRGRLWPVAQQFEQCHQTVQSIVQDTQDHGLDPFEATTWFYVHQRVRRWGVSRRNTGWRWIIDPLQMPCWTYRGMSADPQQQRGDQLLKAVIEATWPGTTSVPTVPQLAYAARRRRVASNRIVRHALAFYDRRKKPLPKPIHTQVLEQHRPEMAEQIRGAAGSLENMIQPDHAVGWLDDQPWSYDQAELFWHVLTLAVWCRTFVIDPVKIQPCWQADTKSQTVK